MQTIAQPFNKDLYSKSPELWQVTTRTGKPVRILCTDGGHEEFPVIGLVNGQPFRYTKNGIQDIIFYHQDNLQMQSVRNNQKDFCICPEIYL